MMYLNLIGAVAGVAFDEEGGGGGGGETFAAEEFVAEEQPAWEETECSNEEGGGGEENPSYEINFNFPRPSIRPNSINNPLAAYLKPNRPPNRPTVPVPSSAHSQHYNALLAASTRPPQAHLAPLTVGLLAHSSRPPNSPPAFPMQMSPLQPMQPPPAMTVTTTAMPVTWSTPSSARPSSGYGSSTAQAPTMTITTTATPQYTATRTTVPPLSTGRHSQPTVTTHHHHYHHHHHHHHHHPAPHSQQRMSRRPVEPEFAIPAAVLPSLPNATTIAPSRRGRNHF